MATPLQAPKGTVDILPDEAARWRRVEAVARELCARYRYGEIRTPSYEATEVFTRGIGENTDIVGKEMFTFEDRGGRSLTLRPENTAGVVRAYVEHKLYTQPAPQKLWYMGPMFRAERPQKGRQRQFTQLGVECLGTEDPRFDAEAIVLAADFLWSLGIQAFASGRIPGTLKLISQLLSRPFLTVHHTDDLMPKFTRNTSHAPPMMAVGE